MLISGDVRGHWRWIADLGLALIAWRLPIFDDWLKKGPWVLLISAKFYPAVAIWLLLVAETLRLRTRPAAAGVAPAHVPAAALA